MLRTLGIDLPDDQENFLDHLAPHPAVQSFGQISSQEREFLHPACVSYRNHQPGGIELLRLGVSGDDWANHLVPGLPDAVIIERAIEAELGDHIPEHSL